MSVTCLIETMTNNCKQGRCFEHNDDFQTFNHKLGHFWAVLLHVPVAVAVWLHAFALPRSHQFTQWMIHKKGYWKSAWQCFCYGDVEEMLCISKLFSSMKCYALWVDFRNSFAINRPM